MAQTFKGHVVDGNDLIIEVRVELEPGGETPAHAFLMYGGSQIGDFPFNQPDKNDPIAYEANRVANDVAKILTVCPVDVLDPYDEDITWH